jgi:putative tryptophan/tyrosine transport system substrate-binding protein
MPVIGFMNGSSPEAQPRALVSARNCYIEDHNIKIEYRWAQNRYDRLPGMAADLVRRSQ